MKKPRQSDLTGVFFRLSEIHLKVTAIAVSV